MAYRVFALCIFWLVISSTRNVLSKSLKSSLGYHNLEVEVLKSELYVSAWNIQVLGVTKMSKPEVVDILVRVIQRYDVVIIQEIRDASNTAIHQLLADVNKGAGDWQMELSERLGRTSSKEQYAFFYRSSALRVQSTHQYYDELDVFERPPFMALFTSQSYGIPDFVFLGIHVKPSDAVAEIDNLADVYYETMDMFDEENMLIGGDLNAACSYVRASDWDEIALWTDRTFYWLIGNGVDTTVSTSDCAYDRFVVAGDALKSSVVAGSPTVFRFDSAYGLSYNEAKSVSDHYPIELRLG